MTVTTKSRRPAKGSFRPFRWFGAVALFALAPKCLLCVAAYVGLGATWGISGREICGGAASPLAVWVPGLALLAATLGCLGLLAARRFPAATASRCDIEPKRREDLVASEIHLAPDHVAPGLRDGDLE